ncbi:hypothetical protein EZV76_03965 [Flagellimonas alvinocaridis]|uniref:GLPGLI family protein n=1 Tax=Flagellimonas alvinocaridis TaxID=2530200 RepID=A0A4S8RS09_9FLAO|nr:hypothetical protein [Allomuricauda alvinocaridis]THV61493.1 hypothetical protein EZV76_03965 [Allomuricauda alvinocaridis]
MKPALFAFFLCFSVALSAQTKTFKLSHYVLPEFAPGTVLMKNGEQNKALLNYNSLSEEMVFQDGEGKKAIVDAQLERIDTVYIKNRKFFRMDGTFYELLHKSSVELYAEYQCTAQNPGKPTAFGQTSQTSSNESYTWLELGGRVYDLELPSDYKIKTHITYWLKKDGKLEKAKNLNQLKKLYSAKKDETKTYLKKHDLEFDNPEQVAQMVQFLESAP